MESFEDLKVFKKFLRTKTNVLVLFTKDEASIKPISSLLNEVALATKGNTIPVKSNIITRLLKDFFIAPR